MAVPLCLPNNYKWDPNTGQCTRTIEERSSLYVVEEALQRLKTIKGPVCVVAVAGPCRQGKSFILGEAFDQPGIFPLGHELDLKTIGIWMSTVPAVKDSNGQELTVVLLDTEGIGAREGLGIYDIFTLTVLLASILIYNSSGVPTRCDLEGLDLFAELLQRIQSRTNNGEYFHMTFPYFIWLLRNESRSLPKDCETIKEFFLKRVFKKASSGFDKSQDVAESILRFFPGFDAFSLPLPSSNPEVVSRINENKKQCNPAFLKGIIEFKCLLKKVLAPKRSFTEGEVHVVTGEGLAALVILYVDAINTPGMVPNIQDAWTTFVSTKCDEAQNFTLKAYVDSMKSHLSGRLPCSNAVIRERHDTALQEAMARFEAETVGLSTSTVEPLLTKIKDSMTRSLSSWLTENVKITRKFCKDLLAQLRRQHLEPVLAKLFRENGAKISFAEITGGYDKIEYYYNKLATGEEDICAAVFFEIRPELKAEMNKHMKHLIQLKEYDEHLTAERFAKAFQEQERKRLEAERNALQQQNLEQQVELKILRTQREEDTRRRLTQVEARMSNMERRAAEEEAQKKERESAKALAINKLTQNPAGPFVTPTDLSKVRPDLHPGSERVYKMTANPRGLALIINNRTFDRQAGLSERFGSEKDVESVQQLFEGFQFEVHTETNLTRSRIQQVLEDFAQKDHSRFDCFVVWLMSHGNDSVVYGTDGETVQIETARNFFSNASCESLKGKPKLFFIQACRGSHEDKGVVTDAPYSPPVETRTIPVHSSRLDENCTIPDQSDFMTAHAAVSGYVSYRSEKGSSYVRCLVEVFRERAGYEHLMEMLTEVTNRVSDIEHRVAQSSNQKLKQCPEQVPRLRKLLFFWPGL